MTVPEMPRFPRPIEMDDAAERRHLVRMQDHYLWTREEYPRMDLRAYRAERRLSQALAGRPPRETTVR